jgi:hypothetical protein
MISDRPVRYDAGQTAIKKGPGRAGAGAVARVIANGSLPVLQAGHDTIAGRVSNTRITERTGRVAVAGPVSHPPALPEACRLLVTGPIPRLGGAAFTGEGAVARAVANLAAVVEAGPDPVAGVIANTSSEASASVFALTRILADLRLRQNRVLARPNRANLHDQQQDCDYDGCARRSSNNDPAPSLCVCVPQKTYPGPRNLSTPHAAQVALTPFLDIRPLTSPFVPRTTYLAPRDIVITFSI